MEEHSKPTGSWKRWRESLKHNYRLVVMNNETFEEVGSYKLTLLNVYIAVTSLLVVVAMAVVMAIAFTPLKKYIPGYGDTVQMEELAGIHRAVHDLEKSMNEHKTYTDNFRDMLVGNVMTAEDLEESEGDEAEQEMPQAVELSEEEVRLRREMELASVGRSARGEQGPKAGSPDVPLEQHFFVAPVTGEISAAFDPDSKHVGVDILAPKNTAVKAAMDGTVFFSDWTQETGNTIGIQHEHNIVTFYKHNSELLKPAGSKVKAGEAVAIIGNTGKLSTGPHLHFEMWHNGRPVNPTDYINF